MNKIVIVGHPLSDYQEVENLLNACGMATAQPSRREGYMPGQISTTLCKVHSAAPLSQLDTDVQIQQIEAGPVWHGMALDLMLGNLEQPFWGWADPQSIYLLNYWRDLDPSITFILVYDRPHSVLTQASDQDAASLSPETLSQRTRNWAAYNAALLHFFHRNPQRCLLVHSQQVRESASSYLQQVRARIDAPWSERMEQLSAPEAPAAEEAPAAQADDSNNENNNSWCEAPTQANTQPTATHPGATLAVDTVSSAPAAARSARPAPAQNALALFVADALLRQHPSSLQLYEELQAVANLPLADGADVIVNQHTALDAWLVMAAHQQSLQEQARLHHSQTAASQQRLAELQSQQQALQQTHQTGQQENELLLAQLHQVQEELERNYLENQRLQEQARLADTQMGQINELSQRLSHTEALAQQKQQLVERLSQAQAQAEQLAQKRQHVIDEQTRLHHSQTAASQQRLAELQSQQQALQQTHQTGQQENELLLNQLHQVQEELERYYLENQRLKPKPSASPSALPYGAAERVKQQLSYQLGSKMIERSHSLGGWLGMPFALIGVARQYKREQPQRKATQKIPIEKYRDAYEAERVKQHLSYRLGAAFIKHSKNPLRWPVLPFVLRREVKDFNQRKRG